MKVFMIAWIALCFLVVVGLFIAYATDNFPRCVRSPTGGDRNGGGVFPV